MAGFMSGFAKSFTPAFQKGFDKTFKTKEEKEASERKKKLEQLQIDEKTLDLDMKKTQQMHQRAVEEVVQSGFDPNVVAKSLSDYHPNDKHYKYDGKDAKGNMMFSAGQYLKGDDGSYELDDNGNRIFEPAFDKEGKPVMTTFEEKDYKTQVAMRLQPAAWMGHHLEEATRLEKQRFELEKQEKGFSQQDKLQEKGFGFKTEEREDEQEFKAEESEKDRALKRELADKDIEKEKVKQEGKKKKAYTSFTTGTGKNQIEHEISEGDFKKYEKEKVAMNEKLGGEAQATERDMFVLERLRGQDWWRKTVQEYKETGKNPEGIKQRLEAFGMDSGLAESLVGQMGAAMADGGKEDGGLYKFFFGGS